MKPFLQVNDWLEAINTEVLSAVVFHELGIVHDILVQLLVNADIEDVGVEQVNDAVNELS